MDGTKNTEPMSPDASDTECSSIMKINSLKESLNTDFDDRCNMNEHASVKFTSVEIREFEIIIGDNPACRAGAPLSIGWSYYPEHFSASLTDFEKSRGPRRQGTQMVVPKSVRHQILQNEWNFSSDSIIKATKATQKLHNQRHVTAITSDSVFKAEDLLKRAARKVRKIFIRRRSISATNNFQVEGTDKLTKENCNDSDCDEVKSATSAEMDAGEFLVDCGGDPHDVQYLDKE